MNLPASTPPQPPQKFDVIPIASQRLKRAGLDSAAEAAELADRLDATDMLILALETRGPGPHHGEAGVTLEDYWDRIGRMLYDVDADAYAGEALARLRAELTGP